MKYAVISDIHGNLPAFEAVLNDAKAQGAERYLILGDYYLDFPYPNQVAEKLKSMENAVIIAGNKEMNLNVPQLKPQPDTDSQYGAIQWNYHELTKENQAYLCGLPGEHSFYDENGAYLYLRHDDFPLFPNTNLKQLTSMRYFMKMREKPFDAQEYLEYVYTLLMEDAAFQNRLFELPDGAYLSGHTHVQWYVKQNGKLILNPGSCGQPLDFDPDAPYSLISFNNGDWVVEQRRVPYDRDLAETALKNSGLYRCAKAWSDIAVLQLHSGVDTISFFLRYAIKKARKLGDYAYPITNESWDCAISRWPEEKEAFLEGFLQEDLSK